MPARRKQSASAATKVAAPRQARSRASMQRVLEATEELLCERPFEDIGVHDIVRRARISVGAFYNRFGEKDALLPYLIERHYEAQRRAAEDLYTSDCFDGVDLARRLRLIIEGSVAMLREKRGLYRAIYLRLIARPNELSKAERASHDAITRKLIGWLLERRGEIGHPDPDEAMRFAVIQLFAVLNIQILAGSPGEVGEFSDRDLIEHTHRSMLAFLGVGAGKPGGASKRRPSRRRSKEESR